MPDVEQRLRDGLDDLAARAPVPSEAPCNSNGAAVWAGDVVLQSGGEACRVDAPEPYLSDGVMVTPVAD